LNGVMAVTLRYFNEFGDSEISVNVAIYVGLSVDEIPDEITKW